MMRANLVTLFFISAVALSVVGSSAHAADPKAQTDGGLPCTHWYEAVQNNQKAIVEEIQSGACARELTTMAMVLHHQRIICLSSEWEGGNLDRAVAAQMSKDSEAKETQAHLVVWSIVYHALIAEFACEPGFND